MWANALIAINNSLITWNHTQTIEIDSIPANFIYESREKTLLHDIKWINLIFKKHVPMNLKQYDEY